MEKRTPVDKGSKSFGLFENHCAGCGKKIMSYATGRLGELPRVYCGAVCETKAKDNGRFDPRQGQTISRIDFCGYKLVTR